MGKTVRITVPSDGQGYFARECPVCNGFFKVTPGTGLATESDPYCPYCGHRGPGDTFWTTEQIEYARSMILNRVSGQFLQVVNPQEGQGQLGSAGNTTVRETAGPSSVRLYIEPACQVNVTCPACTLKYAVYGPYRWCPDCGRTGTADIALSNLEVATRLLASAASDDAARVKEASAQAGSALRTFEPHRDAVIAAVGADPWTMLPTAGTQLAPDGGAASLADVLTRTAATLSTLTGVHPS